MINNVLIKNNYYIIDNNYNDEFHIALYYLEDNKCKAIIRRLDDNNWGQDLKIEIMDIDYDIFEKISLGSCNESLKILDLYTNIKLYKCDYSIIQKIPKVIIQTSNHTSDTNIFHYNSIMSIIELNPDYEHKLFNDKECREFIIDNSKNNIFDSIKDDIEKAYDLLIPGKIKSDFFRYFYLYINGGCYINCKMIMKKSLNLIIKPEDDIILCNNENNDNNENIYYNGIIFSSKENKFLLKCIKNIVSNILKSNCGNTPNFLTVNELNINNFIDIKKILIKSIDNIYFYDEKDKCEKQIILKTKYKNYSNSNYKIMHSNNEYFYKDYIIVANFKFLFYPNNFNDKFEIILLKNNIFLIKRIDFDGGWGQIIKLNVINLNTNKISDINIDSSNTNEKIFVV
jgi:mannosyltransferase OCH1-like enzyme